ncbi:MAG: hypothetical protein AMXMBFR84_35940 [Candidatus Hydrogenedentota bacterium]
MLNQNRPQTLLTACAPLNNPARLPLCSPRLILGGAALVAALLNASREYTYTGHYFPSLRINPSTANGVAADVQTYRNHCIASAHDGNPLIS